jgi:hypothetical protein
MSEPLFNQGAVGPIWREHCRRPEAGRRRDHPAPRTPTAATASAQVSPSGRLPATVLVPAHRLLVALPRCSGRPTTPKRRQAVTQVARTRRSRRRSGCLMPRRFAARPSCSEPRCSVRPQPHFFDATPPSASLVTCGSRWVRWTDITWAGSGSSRQRSKTVSSTPDDCWRAAG